MPIKSLSSTTTTPKLPRAEPIKKVNDTPRPATPVDSFCTVIEVKGNGGGGKPTITKAGNDECIVAPPPTTIVA